MSNIKFNEEAISELALNCALSDVICNMEDLTEYSNDEICEMIGDDNSDVIIYELYAGMDPGDINDAIDDIQASYMSTIKHVLENQSQFLVAA